MASCIFVHFLKDQDIIKAKSSDQASFKGRIKRSRAYFDSQNSSLVGQPPHMQGRNWCHDLFCCSEECSSNQIITRHFKSQCSCLGVPQAHVLTNQVLDLHVFIMRVVITNVCITKDHLYYVTGIGNISFEQYMCVGQSVLH